MKVLIAAGGTAGHIMPALRVAEELRAQEADSKILFVTTRKKQDIEIIRARNFSLKSIMSGKLRRYFSLLNLVDPIFVFTGFIQSIVIVIKFRPNIIFAKGGYSSLPVVFAGKLLFRKIIIHESDLKMGLANRLSSRLADKVLVSFPVDNYKDINVKKLLFTGNPIRRLSRVGIDDSNTVLIIGGSQGAKNINDSVLGCLDRLIGKYNVIHLTGENDFNRFKEYKENIDDNISARYKVFPKVFGDDEVSRLLSLATVIIGRAGASSICEGAYLAKPMILIPLLGHQQDNAIFLEKQKAVVLIKDNELTANVLFKTIDNLLSDKERLRKLSENISKSVCDNPEAAIVTTIKQVANI